MFDVLPLDAVTCAKRPLPTFDVSEPAAENEPGYECEWFVLSLLHSVRQGRPGWADDLERLPVMPEADFKALVVEMLGAVKSEQLRPLVESWAASVRAARATEPEIPAAIAD